MAYDITEFSIPTGKVYLSPIVDCFDGFIVSWTIGISPSASLANKMLEKATATLKENEHPILHSDRGGHYRWPGWIERIERAGFYGVLCLAKAVLSTMLPVRAFSVD